MNVNVDMVGRSDEKYSGGEEFIYIIGSDRLSTDLHKINENINQKYTQMIMDYTYNDEADITIDLITIILPAKAFRLFFTSMVHMPTTTEQQMMSKK